jgi:hypothetical protein
MRALLPNRRYQRLLDIRRLGSHDAIDQDLEFRIAAHACDQQEMLQAGGAEAAIAGSHPAGR